jgi:hypothetical protein
MDKSVIIPTGYSTLGDLLAKNIADGGKFSISCSACADWRVLTNEQIAKMIMKWNPLWSPWNRRPPCPTCGRGRTFHAGGSPVRPLLTPSLDDTRDLHYAWWRERNRRLGNPGDR